MLRSLSTHSPEMSGYKHHPIDIEGDGVRLVRLLKGNFGDTVRCDLFQTWLHEVQGQMSYEALSYTWGTTGRTAKITVDRSTNDVTDNLHVALQHLRFKNKDRILWVDAICTYS